MFVLALLWRNDPRQLPPGDLTWDFAQMAYLHHDTGGVGFEDGSRLHEYGYSAEELSAGQTLTVTLSLSPGSAAAATLALVTPALARPTPDDAADPPVIAVATQTLNDESVVFALPVPPDAPPGLYVPRLTIDGARPLLPSGGTRGELFLRPVRVLAAAGEQGSGGAGETPAAELDVRPLAMVVRDPTTLDGRFAWLVDQPLGGRYQVSWRLQNGEGLVLSQLDTQPGYGYPFYNFYAPLSIYVAAAFRFLGFSFVRAIHLAQLAGFIVAGLGMFHLGRRWLGSRWAGLLAAVAYTVAPFHMVNVYVRGDSLAEFWAMAFYPVVLLAADGVVAKAQGSRGAGEQGGKNAQLATRHAPPATRHLPPTTRPIALFALAYAALILSHNISCLLYTSRCV